MTGPLLRLIPLKSENSGGRDSSLGQGLFTIRKLGRVQIIGRNQSGLFILIVISGTFIHSPNSLKCRQFEIVLLRK